MESVYKSYCYLQFLVDMKSYKLLEQTLFTEVKQISLLYVLKTYAKPISASSMRIHPNFKVAYTLFIEVGLGKKN